MVRCANHDRNMFILSMIGTTSQGSFNHDQMKHIQNGGHVERRQVPKRSKIRQTMGIFDASSWRFKFCCYSAYNLVILLLEIDGEG